MHNPMVEEAGTRFFEMASSLGRMHERTLSGLAEATSKTPFGPVFAINASLARMANDGMDTLASRLNGAEAPAPTATKSKAAAKPKPAKKAATGSKPGSKPAAETAPAIAITDVIEPDVADVLVDAPAKSGAVTTPDDLTTISGIGATTAKKLRGAGIETFAQIAEMSEDRFSALLASLDVKSIRFPPKLWIEQAKTLSA